MLLLFNEAPANVNFFVLFRARDQQSILVRDLKGETREVVCRSDSSQTSSDWLVRSILFPWYVRIATENFHVETIRSRRAIIIDINLNLTLYVVARSPSLL
jgi:hypothetical protein